MYVAVLRREGVPHAVGVCVGHWVNRRDGVSALNSLLIVRYPIVPFVLFQMITFLNDEARRAVSVSLLCDLL